MLRDFLQKEGHTVCEAENGEQAMQRVREGHFDLILLCYEMPGMDGMQVLRAVKRINPEIDVVITTAYGTIEMAVDAMKVGALDYITKPIEFEELLLLVDRVSERRTLLRENEILQEQLGEKRVTTDRIIYQSEKMSNLINLAGRVAGSRATILLQGEIGTGRELFARLIHQLSPCSKRPIITVNCGALQEGFFESCINKRSFNVVSAGGISHFEERYKDTLFLKEIEELSPQVQVKLLRFLQGHELLHLGGTHTLRSDVRVISTTNCDLDAKVKEGAFREDLFYRLNVVVMDIPPLRERKEDVPLLIEHFLRRFAAENGKNISGITSEARDLLLKYDYPGNVRELESIIERTVVISRAPVISLKDLPFRETVESTPNSGKAEVFLPALVEELEKRLIVEAMEKTGKNQTRAAELLGISERKLRYKINKYGLK